MNDQRLLSVDFFRGITMLLLIGEFTHVFAVMTDPSFGEGFMHWLGTQFHHHPWNGLRFWDLVQPFFMFIVGVAIPLSVSKREGRGDSRRSILKHALVRSALLLFLGWALYCIGPGRITFRFQNVLAQLAFTYLVAFLIRNRRTWLQLVISFGFLAATELAYRAFPVPGFDQPFTPDKNFGAWFDLLISGELSGGHWVSFNAVPTTAHTIWGVLTGRLMMSNRSQRNKLLVLLGSAAGLLAAGYLLSPVTPIIKRIATTTFVLVSGGWTVLAMAISFWLIEIRRSRNWILPFTVVGMNPLFIYLFAHVGGADLVYSIFKPFTFFLVSWAHEVYGRLLTGLVTWLALWYICYWLYRRRIFFKI